MPNATAETWYQYGRTQALTAFINTPKLIVGVLSKEPLYSLDTDDMLIASGGTAGYCAIKLKQDCPYSLEYIQAWMSNPYTERILQTMGSDFENGFTARGTFTLSKVPFIELDFNDEKQSALYNSVVNYSREIYDINNQLNGIIDKHTTGVLSNKKNRLITEIEKLISRVYRQEF